MASYICRPYDRLHNYCGQLRRSSVNGRRPDCMSTWQHSGSTLEMTLRCDAAIASFQPWPLPRLIIIVNRLLRGSLLIRAQVASRRRWLVTLPTSLRWQSHVCHLYKRTYYVRLSACVRQNPEEVPSWQVHVLVSWYQAKEQYNWQWWCFITADPRSSLIRWVPNLRRVTVLSIFNDNRGGRSIQLVLKKRWFLVGIFPTNWEKKLWTVGRHDRVRPNGQTAEYEHTYVAWAEVWYLVVYQEL